MLFTGTKLHFSSYFGKFSSLFLITFSLGRWCQRLFILICYLLKYFLFPVLLARENLRLRKFVSRSSLYVTQFIHFFINYFRFLVFTQREFLLSTLAWEFFTTNNLIDYFIFFLRFLASASRLKFLVAAVLFYLIAHRCCFRLFYSIFLFVCAHLAPKQERIGWGCFLPCARV